MRKIIIGLFAISSAAIILACGLALYKTNKLADKNLRPGNQGQAGSHDGTYIIEGSAVVLKNGLSETILPDSASKIVTRYFGNEVRADFNADGTEDSAFLLTQDRGGSGTFYYVAALLGAKNGFTGTNTILLGDRIAPQTTEFRDSLIIVNYADRKPDESFSVQPSMGVSRYFKIIGGELKETKPGEASETVCQPSQRNAEACAQVYAPVCATVEIQCIRAPCNPIKETFGNSCEACRNSLVKSYTQGECAK